MEQKKISRRDFIRAAGITAGAGLLAACAPQVVTQVVNQTQVVVQTQVVPQTAVVTQLVNQTQVVNQVVTATHAATKTDGKAYGLAETTGANILFVNTDAVKKAGLDTDPAKMPTDWDGLVTMAQAISKVNKDPKWGNNAFFTYAPQSESIGSILR